MNKKQKQQRVETGSVQFGDDWPGVFIRGDNAGYYGLLLNQFLDDPESFKNDVLTTELLRGLARLLSGCIVSQDGEPKDCQYIKNYKEVVTVNPKEK